MGRIFCNTNGLNTSSNFDDYFFSDLAIIYNNVVFESKLSNKWNKQIDKKLEKHDEERCVHSSAKDVRLLSLLSHIIANNNNQRVNI